MKFNENLRRLRKEKEYSQEYLSIKLDVSRQTISKWENGTAMPDLKKLVEIAEFFEVSMDDLLGLSNPNSDIAEAENAEYIKEANEYTNQLIKELDNGRHASKFRGIIIALVIVSVALIISLIVIKISFASFNSSIDNLNYRIMYLDDAMRNSGNGNSEEYYDVETNILEVYADNPLVVKMEFKYTPSSYPKNAQIYYLIPDKNGNVERLETTENNGEFILTTDIDISVDKSIYFVLDDGENIIKQEVCRESAEMIYGGFRGNGSELVFSGTRLADGIEYNVNEIFNNVSWYTGENEAEFKNGKIVVESNGKEIYSAPLSLMEEKAVNDENTDCFLNVQSFTLKDLTYEEASNLKIYLSAEGAGGISYRLHYNIVDNSAYNIEYTAGNAEIILNNNGEEKIISYEW